jgi:hypothetical protein
VHGIEVEMSGRNSIVRFGTRVLVREQEMLGRDMQDANVRDEKCKTASVKDESRKRDGTAENVRAENTN